MNAFVVNVPFHYYLLRSIYRSLKNSAFIIPPLTDKPMSGEYGSGMSGIGLYNYMYDFLSCQRAHIVDYGEKTKDNLVSFITKNVQNVICPHYFDGIYELENTRIFKMAYSILNNEAVDQLSYKQNFIMDLIFAYGSESVDRFKERGLTAIAVGNPIFDYWFSKQIDKSSLELIKSKLVKDTPTILYLPTHNYYSSIDMFGDTIIGLGKKYNVIVKLHQMTFNGEANRLCKFVSHPEIITLGDFFDPLVLYKAADIILTDVSGALFDALLVEKPVVMLGNSLRKYKVDILTPEQYDVPVEESKLFSYTENPSEVEALIKETFNKDVSVSEELMYALFYHRDGQAGKRAADVILDEKRYPLIPTLEKYEKSIENAQNEEIRNDIIEKRNYFVRKYLQRSAKKRNLLVIIINKILGKFRNLL